MTLIKYRRGLDVPALKHGDVIDWTSFPLNSRPNGRRIEQCPECGRKGEASHYRSGGAMFVHSSRFETFCWSSMDRCTVGKIG